MNAAEAPESGDFVISREFDAPRELVWRAWTDPGFLAYWWGPRLMTNPVCELDVRPGGAYRITMRIPDGTDYPIRGVFREVVPPERLVLTMDCAEHPPDWHQQVKPGCRPGENPAGELRTTVTFEEVGGKTILTVETRFRSAAIGDALTKMGMREGWAESLDKLSAQLAEPGSGQSPPGEGNILKEAI